MLRPAPRSLVRSFALLATRAPLLPRRCPLLACAALATLLATLSSTEASANTLRFSTTAPGGIVATGNTLGLSKDTSVDAPGIRDSIGTFITLDTSSVDGTYPAGTTATWQLNGSSATLTLPQSTELGQADVLYAELLWGGSIKYGGEDVSADLEDTVTLSTAGVSTQVAPDPSTALTLEGTAQTGFAIEYYLRSADVTSFVQTHKSGTYSVEGVPATQADTINSLNAAGWTLVVVFRDDNEPLRNLTVFVGGSFVDEQATEDYAVSGFCAPPSGTIEGKVAISAIEGDANLTGDQLLIAPTVSDPFVNLSGPNNPANNFFCSQLNDANGNLDTSGTFGDVNQDAINGANVVGGRQGWDVTTVPVSSTSGQLFAGQQSAVLRTITTGDSYVPTLAAFQIDVNAPNLTTSTIAPSSTVVHTGDVVTVTSTANNTGLADASSLVFSFAVPAGMQLVSVTSDGQNGDINGNNVDAAALAIGIDEGTLSSGGTRTVALQLQVVAASPSGVFLVAPVWSFDYVTCTGSAPISDTYTHATAISYVAPTQPDAGTPDVDAGNGGGGGGEGEGANGGGEGEGANVGGGDSDAGTGGVQLGGGEGEDGSGGGDGTGIGADKGAPKGCGCSSETPASAFATFAFVGVVAAIGRRRRPA